MSAKFPWAQLGIEPTGDRKAIRSAYAARLKEIDPDEDVAGFADLQEARAEALWLAQEGLWEDHLDDPVEPQQGFAPAFSIDPWQTKADQPPVEDFGVDFGARAVSPDADRVPLGAGWDDVSDALNTDVGDPLAALEVSGTGDVGSTRGQPLPDIEQNEKPARFLTILFPAENAKETRLTLEEYEESAALMHAIVAEAQEAAIDQQGNIEGWLAHYLATAWPRSGPLVEDAITAFGWDRAAGSLDENPAVAFLNERMRSLAFMEELEQPSHKWNVAWTDLRQQGPRPFRLFSGPRINDVNDLLIVLRTQYPDLFEYTYPERVNSYIEPDKPGNPWKWAGLGLIAYLIFVALIADLSPESDGSDTDAPDRSQAFAEWSPTDKQALFDELFGPGVDVLTVAEGVPALETALQRFFRTNPTDETARKQAYDEARRILRYEMEKSAAAAPFEELVALRQHKLDMLRAAREQDGTETCFYAIRNANVPDQVVLDEEFLARERTLAKRLLEADLLRPSDARMPQSASIPGEIVDEVMRSGGFSNDRFNALAGGAGDPAERCDYAIAMLAAILRRPGTVSADLLRIS